ncbi:MAG TPA: DUF4190 domain-containing protein [Anaerolineaceae bacterium]|nr:DUF4190 domain-containing protein [Anaerolineaceae bacterium]
MSNNFDPNIPPQEQAPQQASQGPAPYQTLPPPPPPAPKKTYSVWAIVSLVAGILNFKFAPFGAIAALVTGYVARNEIRESNGTLEGQGMAIAGIVLGWVGLAFSIIMVVLSVLFMVGMITSTPLVCGPFFEWLHSLP